MSSSSDKLSYSDSATELATEEALQQASQFITDMQAKRKALKERSQAVLAKFPVL